MGILMKRKRAMEAGQSVLEYSLLLVIVASAIGAMTLYVRRAVSGELYKIDDQMTGKATNAVGTWVPPVPPI